jgi:hypothetical protein
MSSSSDDFSCITGSTAALRAELEWLRTCYDYGTISPAVFAVIREIETDIAWIEHYEWVRR